MALLTLALMGALTTLVGAGLRHYRGRAGSALWRRALDMVLALAIIGLAVTPLFRHSCGAGTPWRQLLAGICAIVLLGFGIRATRPRRVLLAVALLIAALAAACFNFAVHQPHHTGNPDWARSIGQGEPTRAWHTFITGVWDVRRPK